MSVRPKRHNLDIFPFLLLLLALSFLNLPLFRIEVYIGIVDHLRLHED